MLSWMNFKNDYQGLGWIKLVMSVFTLVVLASYSIVILQNDEAPALAKLNYFYTWALGVFAITHEAQRWFMSEKDIKPALTIIQGEIYVALFILTTIFLLFYAVIHNDIYSQIPNELNELIELTIWVAGAFGFSRISKSFNNQNKNILRLSGSQNKLKDK